MCVLYTVSPPIVNVAILSNKTVGSNLSLRCDANTVQGVISDVEFMWMKNGTIVEMNDRINIFQNSSIIHSSTLHFSYLSESDENNYTCIATILSTNTSGSDNYELNNFTCKFCPIPVVKNVLSLL